MVNDKKIIYCELNGVTLIYAFRDGVVTFTCVPFNLKDKVKEHRLYKDNWCQYFKIDPMVQVARKNDEVLRDFSAGETLYNSSTAYNLRFVRQEIIEDETKKEVRTYLKTEDDFNVTHVVSQRKGFLAFEMWNEIENKGNECYIDRLSSFTIGSLSPFMDENDPSKLILHTLQSYWSIEGRKESTPLSKYNFEDSWSGLGIKIHKIGSRGTMPSKNYHPFVALEDISNNVTWAVQIEAPSSWEIETLHRYGSVVLTGGQADYLYGHWRKKLNHNDIFVSRKAYVSVVEGNLTKACAILTRYHDNLLNVPSIEEDLPIIYNEYLHSWGRPNITNVTEQLKFAKQFNVKYFVIDAGWFCSLNDDLLGDWEVNTNAFPNGLSEYSKKAHELGYSAAGVWYELEAATTNSKISKYTDYLAKVDGEIIKRANRLLLDFNNEKVMDYLTTKVIDNLKNNELNYIKIDYNENIGYGIDDKDSVGEGLRKHAENVVSFMKKITKEVPNLVLENCSSGGMRHEIVYNTIGSMVSFSDAHEIAGGAIIAMDLHRIMQPRIMQIWASILPKLSLDDIYFTMAKSMLGRICLSGQLDNVPEEYLMVVKKGVDFYNNIKNVIKNGNTTLIDTDEATSILHPHGVIRLIRKLPDDSKKVCYIFSFDKDARSFSFKENGYKLTNVFTNATIDENENITFNKKATCAVLVYEKEK